MVVSKTAVLLRTPDRSSSIRLSQSNVTRVSEKFGSAGLVSLLTAICWPAQTVGGCITVSRQRKIKVQAAIKVVIDFAGAVTGNFCR